MDSNTPFVERRKSNIINCDSLNSTIESSTRRWELIVFPSLFAFILLSVYGFYMVYSLANDVHFLALSVDSNMSIMSSNMQSISDNVGKLSADVSTMSINLQSIDTRMTSLDPMKDSMTDINQTIAQINHSIFIMTQSTHHMSRDIHSSSRPMSMFNSMMPW